MRKVGLKCVGVDSIKISVPGWSSYFQIPMERLNTDDFIFDAKISYSTHYFNHRNLNIPRDSEEKFNFMSGNQLILTIDKSSSQFIGIIALKLIVVPDVSVEIKTVRDNNKF